MQHAVTDSVHECRASEAVRQLVQGQQRWPLLQVLGLGPPPGLGLSTTLPVHLTCAAHVCGVELAWALGRGSYGGLAKQGCHSWLGAKGARRLHWLKFD